MEPIRKCPSCGKGITYTTKRQAARASREKALCKACANNKIASNRRLWYRGIRVSWYNDFLKHARKRGIPWELTMDDVADQFARQHYKCNLTGISVKFPKKGKFQKAPASIDRIDSRLPYRPDNIQIVFRKINMMKKDYSQQEFIELCLLVALREEYNALSRESKH